MLCPKVNINGTSKKELLRNYIDAKSSIDAAVEKMNKIMPHGRDYQTYENSSEMYQRDRAIFYKLISDLQFIKIALEETAISILEQE